MKWLPMLKPDQNSSQETEEIPFWSYHEKKILTSAGQQNITAGVKGSWRLTHLSLLKMEKQQKQSLIAR